MHHKIMESSFICLLPSREDAARLHRTFDALFSIHAFPYIKLPLHITVYFFPKSTAETNVDAIDWIKNADRAIQGSIVATTEHVRSFTKSGKDFVYYLPIVSEQIIRLHNDLHHTFKQVHIDPFDFIPHLSLFYPDRNLTEEERNFVQKIYKDIENMTFDRLAFATEKNNGTHIVSVQTL